MISVFLIVLAANIFWGPMAITIMGAVLAVPAFYALWFQARDHEGRWPCRQPTIPKHSVAGLRPVRVAAE
jgi:hypothetical protein